MHTHIYTYAIPEMHDRIAAHVYTNSVYEYTCIHSNYIYMYMCLKLHDEIVNVYTHIYISRNAWLNSSPYMNLYMSTHSIHTNAIYVYIWLKIHDKIDNVYTHIYICNSKNHMMKLQPMCIHILYISTNSIYANSVCIYIYGSKYMTK